MLSLLHWCLLSLLFEVLFLSPSFFRLTSKSDLRSLPASMKYEYDTNGVYFHYFLLSLLGLFLIPTTYGYIQKIAPKSTKDDGVVTGSLQSDSVR